MIIYIFDKIICGLNNYSRIAFKKNARQWNVRAWLKIICANGEKNARFAHMRTLDERLYITLLHVYTEND